MANLWTLVGDPEDPIERGPFRRMERDRRPDQLTPSRHKREPAQHGPWVRWLEALVETFGPSAVAEWQDPPEGWDYRTWKHRHDVEEIRSRRARGR
jgi:hypothetical protein